MSSEDVKRNEQFLLYQQTNEEENKLLEEKVLELTQKLDDTKKTQMKHVIILDTVSFFFQC